MQKKEIETREDVNLLVKTFYGKVREDDFIGPIFNDIIDEWEEHFEKLTDFWETNLFFQRKYKGNPMKVHQEVDQKVDQKLSTEHFGRWIHLWFQTIDELFTGEKAGLAKTRARNMSTFMFIRIYKDRKQI